MESPVDALVRAYPDRFTGAAAEQWVAARRALLVDRAGPPTGPDRSVSSGCATAGAVAHARELADDAAHALLRLEAGLGTTCENCAVTLPFDRVDSLPAAVRCTSCVPRYQVDTRWCR